MNTEQLKTESQLLSIAHSKLQNYIKKTIELDPESIYRKQQIRKLCNDCKRKIYKIDKIL